jgi:anaerobic C4-dicarboxylate transporter DcuA/anaerobic C4-dicarboxylate transporter DcuB
VSNLELIVHGLVVIGCIYMGVRAGGLGLGIWGLFGVCVLAFMPFWYIPPGAPPTDAVFIVIAVITAASAMQAAGGTDWMVAQAARAIRSRPKSVVYMAPLMSFLFTVGAGTGNIYYPLLPVIYDVSYRQKIRPERPLAISAVASQVGILASPVSAATAALIATFDDAKEDFSLTKVLLIMWPACLIGLAVAAFVMSKKGTELVDDPVYQQRLAAGLVKEPEVGELDPKALPANARRSALIFLTGVAVIVTLGLFSDLRPTYGHGDDAVQLSVTLTIQIVMGVVGALILLLPGVKGSDVAKQPTFTAGMTGAIALFGLAWLAQTFVSAHETQIDNALGDLVQEYKLTFALALFIVGALTTSQSGTTKAIVPVGLSLGLSAATITAMWPAVMGMYFLPANGSQIATVAFDQTGTTKIGNYVLNHSFLLPVMVFIVIAMLVAFPISAFF